MRMVAAFVAIVLVAGTGLLAREPAPLTKISVRAMPTRVLTRRLFGDLGWMMLPNFSRGQPGVRPTRPLRDLYFMTTPHAAGWQAGLCESSWVTVLFEPVRRVRGADTVVRPTRFSSVTGYFAADPRRVRDAAPSDDAAQARLERLCRRIDPRTRNLFSAGREDLARPGLLLLVDLVEAARGRRVMAALDCTHMAPAGDPPLTADACLQTVAGFDPDRLSSVDDCGPEPLYPPLCYLVRVESIELRFRLGTGGAVEQVVLSPMIIVADRRID